MATLKRSFLFVPFLAVIALGALLIPRADARKVAKYKICDTAKPTLIPANDGFVGCYVDKSAANIAFAQKAIDKAFTDIMDPAGDNYSNLPQGEIDCKAFFDRKDRRSGLLHCIRTFNWTHTHGKNTAHRGSCQYGVSMTYTVGGVKKQGGRAYIKYVPAATPYGFAWTHQDFKTYFGKSNPPTPECKSAEDHDSGGLELAPLLPDDPLFVPILDPELDDA